jgi:putative flippase GtrA
MTPATEVASRISAAARQPAKWIQLFKFCLVGGSGYLINLVVLEALVSGDVVGELTAQAIAVAVAMPFNFVGNKLWTFDE